MFNKHRIEERVNFLVKCFPFMLFRRLFFLGTNFHKPVLNILIVNQFIAFVFHLDKKLMSVYLTILHLIRKLSLSCKNVEMKIIHPHQLINLWWQLREQQVGSSLQTLMLNLYIHICLFICDTKLLERFNIAERGTTHVILTPSL